jgi:hypothetical protein
MVVQPSHDGRCGADNLPSRSPPVTHVRVRVCVRACLRLRMRLRLWLCAGPNFLNYNSPNLGLSITLIETNNRVLSGIAVIAA